MSNNILVAVDTTDPDCWPLLRDASKPYWHKKNTIHLVHVVPEEEALGPLSQFIPEGFSEQHRKETKNLLAAMAGDINGTAGIKLHLRSGQVYVEVLDLAKMVNANVIVIGANSPELKDYLLGPKAARIARHASCSVLVARP